MAIDLENGHRDLSSHIGHQIECVSYAGDLNVALECVSCGTVLLDFERPQRAPMTSGSEIEMSGLRHEHFWLDSARLATFVIGGEEQLFGFDSADERGFAAAIASRFRDAEEAGAIFGPGALDVVLYALDSESLIVAVRERELPRDLDVPMRQVATFSFDATDLVSYGDDSFEECCNGIAALLERANELLPAFAALHKAEGRQPEHGNRATTKGANDGR